MQLNKLILCFLVVIFSSCNTFTNSNQVNSNIQVDSDLNFLDPKYGQEFTLVIDESNISDHPQFSYLDCDNEGYFTVHFIPKTEELRNFWKEGFYENVDLSSYEPDQDRDKIKDLVLKNQKDYQIFAYQIEGKDLEGYCTFEAVYASKNAMASLFHYTDDKQWEFFKEVPVQLMPPYPENSFFLENFPEEFSEVTGDGYQENSIKKNTMENIPSGYVLYNERPYESKNYVVKIFSDENEFENNNPRILNLYIKQNGAETLIASSNKIIPCLKCSGDGIDSFDNFKLTDENFSFDKIKTDGDKLVTYTFWFNNLSTEPRLLKWEKKLKSLYSDDEEEEITVQKPENLITINEFDVNKY